MSQNQFEKDKKPKYRKYPTMHENNAWNMKINAKGGAKETYRPWEREIMQKDRRKTTKSPRKAQTGWWEDKSFWKSFEKWKVTWKRPFFKNIQHDFRSIENYIRSVENPFDWSKSSLDRSSQPETFTLILKHFRSVENKLRSIEILEKLIFWKNTPISVQSPLKALYFMRKMHEYEMRFFPKTHVFNPDLSKQDFLLISKKKNSNKPTCSASISRNSQTWLVRPKNTQ